LQKVKVNKTSKEAKLPKPSLIYSEKFRVGMGSVVACLVILTITMSISGPEDAAGTRSVGIVFALLAAIVPLALIQLKEVHRKESIDKFLPLFLLALVSSVRSGSNLIKALEHTAGRNMGALTAELKNLRANISWGMPIDEALENFAQRAGTRTSRRVVILLEMALRIGGDIATNLDMIHKHVTELANIEKERRSSLAPYTYTIYIAFVVFIGISVILSSQFFTEIEKVQEMMQGMGDGSSGTMFSSLIDMDINELNSILFNMAIIEAIFGGLAAGKIGTGSFVAGIKHIVIMVVIAVIAFAFI
jgi:flagellar protein FlaJ